MLIILPTTYKWVQIQMIPKHQQINVWMNMSETPEKKKARLRYDNVFKTAWTDEFHFIKHSQKGNKIAFCKFCRTDFSIKHRGHSDVTKHVGTAKHKGKLRMFSHPDPWQCFYQEVANLLFKVLTRQILYPKCSRMHHFASPSYRF